MIRKIYYLLPVCFFLFFNKSIAQNDIPVDGHLWAFGGLSYQIDDKWTATWTHLFRFREDISEYRDQFNEPGIQYKFNKNFNIKASYRYTIRPDVFNQHWIFLDINNKIPLWDSPLFLSNRIRIHYGFDYNDNIDADFFRELLRLNYSGVKKWTFFVDVEPFIRMNEINKLQVFRYEAGGVWKIHPQWTITAYYRREDIYAPDPLSKTIIFHVPVVGVRYKIAKKSPEDK